MLRGDGCIVVAMAKRRPRLPDEDTSTRTERGIAMTTTSNVILIRRTRKRAGGTAQYWNLRWRDSRGDWRYEALGRVDKMSATAARARLREKIADMGSGRSSRDKTVNMTVRAG